MKRGWRLARQGRGAGSQIPHHPSAAHWLASLWLRWKKRADWPVASECHCFSSVWTLEFVCVCVCVCVCVHLCELIAIHWVVDCVLLSTLALFVRTLHTLGTHTHTCTHKHTHTHTHIWIWTRHSSSGRAFAKSERKREREGKKERGRKYELTNSTIHSHGSAVLAGPGLRHEWVWS